MLVQLRTRLAGRLQRISLVAAAAAQHQGPAPDLAGTVELETPFARLLIDASDEVIRPAIEATHGWEPGETALLGGRLRPGMTVVDGGAHVGYFSCLAGRLVGPRGLVLAFEPAPRNHELLLANVWRNGLTNVVCFPWALGAANGFADLHLAPGNTGDHRLHAPGEARERVRVRVAALDSILAIRPPVHVVKLDLQGAEGDALRGMERLVAASPDILVTVEFWPAGIRAAGDDPGELLAYYRSLGLRIQVQPPDEKVVLDWSDEEILRFCSGDVHTNLVLTSAP